MRLALILTGIFCAGTVWAGPLKLEPADPQPVDLKPGLAVSYAKASVRTLAEAAEYLDDAQPGEPLTGLDYRDTADGDPTLTWGKAHKVVAGITGYVRFDEPGVYLVDFLSNDGLQMIIGGQEVTYFDGVHPCEVSELAEVEVPVAGWYELEGLYFQRKGSACLHMRAGMDEPDWMPNEAFGH
jgi:hypothetical protein